MIHNEVSQQCNFLHPTHVEGYAGFTSTSAPAESWERHPAEVSAWYSGSLRKSNDYEVLDCMQHVRWQHQKCFTTVGHVC